MRTHLARVFEKVASDMGCVMVFTQWHSINDIGRPILSNHSDILFTLLGKHDS